MRANYKMQRLFVPQDLAQGIAVEASPEQSHYLIHVLRMAEGAELLVFNGRDGEWLARVAAKTKKAVRLEAVGADPAAAGLARSPLLLCAAEAGTAGLPRPEGGRDGRRRAAAGHHAAYAGGEVRHRAAAANAVEAAEQCGILAIPEVREPVKFEKLLAGWEKDRRLIFCDESAQTNNPLPALQGIAEKKLALLVGPEGGFSDDERKMLRALPFVTAIPLGPRILRADTAAVAALAVIQATVGDW